MYFVPDGTNRCGYYECEACGYRFLDLKIGPCMACPYCSKEPDMEIGPDEEIPLISEDAKLIQMIEGEEEVQKYDMLLSLAITGGDYEWI